MSWRSITLTFFALFLSQICFYQRSYAANYTSEIDSEEFGNCIASQINNAGAKFYLEERQKLSIENRKRLLARSPKTLAPLNKMNLIGKTISQEAALASIPLIDFSKLPEDGKTKLPKANMLFMRYCKDKPCENPDLVSKNDWAEQIKKSENALKDSKVDLSADEYSMRVNQVLYAANPIVDWLLQKKQGSVDHWQLLKYATGVFDGDVLTALAVIGELFKQETLFCKDRNKEAVLASKMKRVVIEDDKFSVGLNYHFWQLISASIIRNGTTLGRIYGVLDNNEPAYKFANKKASAVADVILKVVGYKDRKCFLVDNPTTVLPKSPNNSEAVK